MTGNYSNSKGTVTYDGKDYKICVKMESSTVITITPTYSGTVTLIFGGSTSPANQKIKLDGKEVTLDANGQYSFQATAGRSYELRKASVQIFLYLILLPSSTTDIHAGESYTNHQGNMYNLAGQRINGNYKGVVIKNGKKYIQ